MTCASCAARVEKKLNKLDGVRASVNYATEKAKVAYDGAGEPGGPAGHGRGDRLHRHAACSPATRRADRPPRDRRRPRDLRLAPTAVISAVLTAPVLAMSMIPALQFDNWQWLSLTLASPVVVWGGLAVPPGRLGQPPPRRGHDGHAHLGGRLAAYRLVAVGAPVHRRGHGRHADGARPLPQQGAGDEPSIYLEIAVGGDHVHPRRPVLRGKAKRRSGAALRALLDLGAKEVAVLRDGRTETRVPVGQLAVGDLFVVRPGEKVATDGVVAQGRRPSTPRC